MKGYKTIIVNAVTLISSVFVVIGFDIPEANWAALTTGIVAMANIILRFVTTTPVGESTESN